MKNISKYYDIDGKLMWKESWILGGHLIAGQDIVHESITYVVIGAAFGDKTHFVNLRKASAEELKLIRKWGASTGMDSPKSYWRPLDEQS